MTEHDPAEAPEGAVESANNGADRTPDGKFGWGNRFAAGRHNRRMGSLRAALLDAVSDDDVRAVGLRLAALARGGDVQAAKLLLEHVCGRPAQAVELSSPEGGPLKIVGVEAKLADPAYLAQVVEIMKAHNAPAVMARDAALEADDDPPPPGGWG